MTLAIEKFAEIRWHRWSTSMQIVVTDPDALAEAKAIVDDELDAVDAVASRFRPDSEIMRLAEAGGRPTEISETLTDLLEAALTAAELTDGDVDPTLGAAMISLGYDRDIAILGSTLPRVSTLITAANWSMVHLQGRVVTVPPGVLLDLGATAKAVAADLCAQRVHGLTGSGVLVNLGGDIATAGAAPDGGWQVLVQDTDDDPASSIALPPGAALATSSTVRRRWRNGEETLHHILNPRTGRSADPVWRTVSVAAQSCYAANIVATAAVIRGWAAPDWISTLDMPARLVGRDRVVSMMGGWPEDGTEPR
jgi:thiamine biosynthesis lipoprotein